MKKHITLALGLVVLSGSAFASKARLEALGEDANGSQWIGDSRNVFLNASHLNYHKDLVTLEWGDESEKSDSASTPKAEGGFFKSEGNLVYGLYLGRESTTSNSLRDSLHLTSNFPYEENNFEVFVAGDAGVQWGASLLMGSTKEDDPNSDGDDADATKSSAMRANIGVISGDVEGFLNLGLGNTAESGDDEFKGKGSTQLGVTYHMGDIALMAQMVSIGAESTVSDQDTEYKYSESKLGAGKNYKLNDKANVWVSAWYRTTSSKVTSDVSAAESDTKTTNLPVGIALEVMAKEWLSLRGSISQDVFISETKDSEGMKESGVNKTNVRAGASLVFGDLSVDGMIGNDDTGAGTPTTSTDKGVLRTDSLMSRVSLTYRF